MDWTLQSERLTFRELNKADFDALRGFLQDIEVMRAWEHAFTDDEVRRWIEENRMRYARDGFSYCAAISRETGGLIGVAGLLAEQAGGESHTGLGYILGKAFWHRGYALESARAWMAHAFDTLGLDEVTAQIRPENLASRRVAERLGMVVKGEFVRHYRGKDMIHLLYSRKRNV